MLSTSRLKRLGEEQLSYLCSEDSFVDEAFTALRSAHENNAAEVGIMSKSTPNVQYKCLALAKPCRTALPGEKASLLIATQ